ncbi:RNA polymerase sigma factor [Streptomyces vilmorinianum]|uniref:RNA polymerase sigma factor n=1 Tax=Streptomyces vilmorinianum TaxID=3051092 RepID=UPI0010FB5489|nr:sigma-70 family RNA polymerase sigma factor [Streptomyces vilmorinianum]
MNGSSRRAPEAEDPFSSRGEDGRTLHAEIRGKVFHSLRTFRDLGDTDRYEITDAAILTAYRAGRLDPAHQPVAYVKKIAHRQARAYLAARSKEDLTGDFVETWGDLAGEDGMDCDGLEPGDRTREDREVWEIVDNAIRRISAPQCRAVMERQSQGQDDDTIATGLGTSKNTVYQQRSRGLGAIETELKDYIRPAHKPPTPAKQGEQ